MDKYLAIVLFVVLSSFCLKEEFEYADVSFHTSSSLFIQGSSNVNTFQCHFNMASMPAKTRIYYQKNEPIISFKNAKLKLTNQGFNCGSRLINKDFHELLQSEKYPFIHLELEKIVSHDYGYTAYVEIQIAGKKIRYAIPIKQKETTDKYSGKLDINITDFNLVPPKKMLGAIVVREEISIHFDFKLTIETFTENEE